MKITYVGTPTKDTREWYGKCKKCNSTAEAVESELEHVTNNPFAGPYTGMYAWQKCPVCGAGDDVGYQGMLFIPKIV